MKIVIPGGSGQVGSVLRRAFVRDGHEAIVLTRNPDPGDPSEVFWDGSSDGEWTHSLEGADAVINLAGRNVNCRYNPANRREIMSSRVDSARVVGEAIASSGDSPKVWLQMSTATIYEHTYGPANDDLTGVIGGNEPGAPDTWNFSIDVATSWEKAANDIETRNTRKVLMRSAIVMSPDRGGPFDVLLWLVRMGLGGTAGDGRQFVSWVHDRDFVSAVCFLIENDSLEGPVNIAAPNPIPNAEFMRELREAWGAWFGIPSPEFLLELGAIFLRTETELILKSRRVVSKRLTDTGFEFEFTDWKRAAEDLCERWRKEI
ncbi:MAG: TIGR01777 family protein [Acidobacteria bacterium]|nr:MAG: TIGR01777 family protein [Acidobacteriota bacterium]REJ98993.1 MAG: TIGR01777 family protein [Acidobacteriota bacterium]REK16287.1 MAG: TIGR01777 family protein [Acidobacteriota bacterium]REK43968.1 MAG: TIGR01777 family protein [Acidobacteriota bacterium]